MTSTATFARRHGVLEAFTFKGQYYGTPEGTPCRGCGSLTRQCFNVRTAGDRAVVIGPCCFKHFRLKNPVVFAQLQAAKFLLEAVSAAIVADTKRYAPLSKVEACQKQVRFHEREIARLKRQMNKISVS
jgi:hypothetical protein